MQIYEFYTSLQWVLGTAPIAYFKSMQSLLLASLIGAVILWLPLYILYSIGLYKMAKGQNLKKKWMAFFPFVNTYYMGKIAGETNFFGKRMKNAGLYAMITEIVATTISFALIAGQIYLHFAWSGNRVVMDGSYYWDGLTGFPYVISVFIDYSDFIILIIRLVYQIFTLILMLSLVRKYAPSKYFLLSFLTILVPAARYIVVFVLRNRPAVDYVAYVKAKQEEYMRRQQEYYKTYGNPYGNPYNNPYGNPYGNPYNRNPYGPQNNPNQNSGESNAKNANDDPFAEFSSDKKSENANGEKNEEKASGKHTDADDFFN